MWVADLSSGWPGLTGQVLRSLGCSGVIGYIGCDYAPKNVSRDRLWDWLDNALPVGLVIENGAQDMLGGGKAGATLGQNWLRGAEAVGYDVANCIGYTPADWNVQPSQYAAVEDAFGAFASYVPVHGLYGPGPLLNRTTAHGLWNSNSTSFGATSPRACLVQHYNDPRAQGHALDVNDVISQPLYFQGEDVPLTDADIPVIQRAIAGLTYTPFGATSTVPWVQWVGDARLVTTGDDNAAMVQLTAIIQQLGSLASLAGQPMTPDQITALGNAIAAVHPELTEADVVDAITKTIKIGA